MTHGALIKIDLLIEEAGSEDNFLNLGTNGKRLLATRIHGLDSEEKKKLGYISKRLLIGAKNGLIDASFGAIILGLIAAAATGGSVTIAGIAAVIGAAVGSVSGFKGSRKVAYMGSDMDRVMGEKQIVRLVKELESLIGKPLVNLIKLDGRIRLK